MWASSRREALASEDREARYSYYKEEIDLYDLRFAHELRDPAWAKPKESEIYTFFEEHASKELSVYEVECRSNMCRIHFDGGDVSRTKQLIALTGGPDSPSQASRFIASAQDKPSEAIWFAMRSDHDLPSLEELKGGESE